jgi:hypothetical protein
MTPAPVDNYSPASITPGPAEDRRVSCMAGLRNGMARVLINPYLPEISILDTQVSSVASSLATAQTTTAAFVTSTIHRRYTQLFSSSVCRTPSKDNGSSILRSSPHYLRGDGCSTPRFTMVQSNMFKSDHKDNSIRTPWWYITQL